MSEEDKTTPNKLSTGPLSPNPESPTTARPLDFDDEPQETGVTAAPSTAPTQQGAAEAAPPKPPRPLSPRQQAENTLKEAFPSIEASVIKAVLVASNWDVERSFHALLSMTDPSAAEQDAPPPKPPRPTAAQRQLEADEMYARQLAEHYNRPARQPRWDNEYPQQRPRRGSDGSEEKEYSFFDDDLPVIRENLRKGFLDTQTKVNSWVQNLKKRLDGEPEAGPSGQDQPEENYGRPRRSGDLGRRSGDRERYDADHRILNDDFASLELRDAEAPPPRPPRPLANPNLFKSSSPSPDRRKVSFQEGPPTEIDNLYDASEPVRRTSPATGKSSKWQPLSTVDPSPVGEHDPFSLGDSDDEKEKEAKAKEQSTAEAGPASEASKDNSSKAENAGKS
ncbi:CUE domain protein [Aspergillus eucalypticola CBS 122712]|uniref:CUE domain protein n=1 Tax=Aspergillus eucalypticola (strain CBS 122712 / IBT 29274) TaxID=1448314 RepID=A0A317V216_ASPEC|nr:CUE domain protein [Aspergillus eucalypticola CBS 122712]PWY67441.1 CUE domain protein [Aspergillus eucalypticola CBS 122712]